MYMGLKMPQTPRAKKVIEYAVEESRTLNHEYVGTEHLLLGLLRESEAVASLVLKHRGLTTEQVREAIVHLHAGRVGPAPVSAPRREIEDLPAELKAAVAPLDAEIRSFKGAKEEAVGNQEFYKAVCLRDEERKLRRKRQSQVREWFVNRRTEPLWLSANEGAALRLAQSISEQRSWNLLPNLADALEQAGCNDADLLGHCREPGAHSSQCWVVDLLLAHAGDDR
jgi:hypothetical protein